VAGGSCFLDFSDQLRVLGDSWAIILMLVACAKRIMLSPIPSLEDKREYYQNYYSMYYVPRLCTAQ